MLPTYNVVIKRFATDNIESILGLTHCTN